MNNVLAALLGKKQNMYLTPAIKAAKFARMATPIGAATTLGMFGAKKGYDWWMSRDDEDIEDTPNREDYLSTLNNKFTDEDLDEFLQYRNYDMD